MKCEIKFFIENDDKESNLKGKFVNLTIKRLYKAESQSISNPKQNVQNLYLCLCAIKV